MDSSTRVFFAIRRVNKIVTTTFFCGGSGGGGSSKPLGEVVNCNEEVAMASNSSIERINHIDANEIKIQVRRRDVMKKLEIRVRMKSTQ